MAINNRELIELLQKLPPDDEPFIHVGNTTNHVEGTADIANIMNVWIDQEEKEMPLIVINLKD
jgi:hypothetical protein